MSQHPRSVPSGSGLAVREGFNNALDSAFTLNSGPVAPASPQAGLLWLDTAAGLLKIRNDANTQWLDLADRLAALRHDGAQTLTSGQKQQARENIAAVSYEAQALTSGQKQQARENMGLAYGVWQNVLASRSFSIVYTNTDDKVRTVNIWGASGSGDAGLDVRQSSAHAWIQIAGIVLTGGAWVNVTGEIPPGWQYRLRGTAGSLGVWAEK